MVHGDTAKIEEAGGRPIVVVAGHLCLDLHPALPAEVSLTPNTLTKIGPAEIATGGCVANVGIALHRLGVTAVRLVGCTGEDALAGLLRQRLDDVAAGLGDRLRSLAGEATSYSIVIEPGTSDRLFWHCPGVNDVFRPADVDADATVFDGAAWLHVGYPPLMKQFMVDGGSGCAELFKRAKARGLRTSLDLCSIDPASEAGRTDWPAWLAGVLPSVDYFVPSFDEIATVFGEPATPTPERVRGAAARLRDLGASTVVLKLGDLGLYALDKQETCHPCFQVQVAGTTGSGDATIAGLIAALVEGEPLEDALRFAAAVGATSCEGRDATSGVMEAAALRERLRGPWLTLDGLRR